MLNPKNPFPKNQILHGVEGTTIEEKEQLRNKTQSTS
jgi:hypothetical protein